MSNKLGRFEILSEIASAGPISLYKASDGEGSQTVALKVLDLATLGEQSGALVKELTGEAEASKALKSGNIAQLLAAEEIEGKFVASMEYVQGNSIATMMARNEGFSIWDLQDIIRQSCQALDHAHTRKVAHHTLEPAKIMVTWDGSTKILSYGVSLMSAAAAKAEGAVPVVLRYMSPEQVRGEAIDIRSNIFSLGVIMYEMMAERKAFGEEDAAKLRKQILEESPAPPEQFNPKISDALSALITKAMAKDPAQRYQSGQELISDLEKCKNQPASAAAKSKEPARGFTAPVKAAGFAGSSNGSSKPASAEPVQKKTETSATADGAPQQETETKARAAAAGWGGATTTTAVANSVTVSEPAGSPTSPASADSAGASPANTSSSGTSSSSGASISKSVEKLSSTAEVESPEKAAPATPKIAVDPLMAEPQKSGAAKHSFSEINELPPLKEVFVAPPAAVAEPELPEQPEITIKTPAPPEKPKLPPRVVAQRAVKEIKKTPPQLFVYAIAAAALIMLIVVGSIAYRIHSGNSDDDGYPAPAAQAPAPKPRAPVTAPQVAPASIPPSASIPAVPVQEAQLPPSTAAPAAAEAAPTEEAADNPPNFSVKPKASRATKAGRKRSFRGRSAAPAVVPGELTINTTPAGAEVSIDGQKDPSWVTPFNMGGVPPGQHTITVSKPGFGSETRAINVSAGSKAILVLELASTSAVFAFNSTPEGAEIWMDGRNTGHVTPAQISVEKAGSHTVTFKKQGYLEEPITANAQSGQTARIFHVLKILGVTDEIHYKKMFGGGKSSGMATVSIKTDPKGAQIAVNHRVLEKNTPAEFYLNPGTYVLDITMSGHKSIHRVITLEKDGKFNLEQSLDNE